MTVISLTAGAVVSGLILAGGGAPVAPQPVTEAHVSTAHPLTNASVVQRDLSVHYAGLTDEVIQKFDPYIKQAPNGRFVMTAGAWMVGTTEEFQSVQAALTEANSQVSMSLKADGSDDGASGREPGGVHHGGVTNF